MQLNIKSQSILNEFVECCLTLDEERITSFLKVNPSLIKVCEYGSDPMPFLDSIKEIFNEFKKNNPTITVTEKKCIDCICGDLVKLFTVTYESNPLLNSGFGFMIKLENGNMVQISEFSETRSYMSRLKKRLYDALNEQQVIEQNEAMNSLPDLGKCNCRLECSLPFF